MLKQCIVLSCLLCLIQAQHSLTAVCPAETDCDAQTLNSAYFHCTLETNNCPDGYLCCKNCHYTHPVCLEATYIERRCPTVSFCEYTLIDYMLSCDLDEECTAGNICCEHGCYVHKICTKPRQIQKESEYCKSVFQKPCTKPLAYSTSKHVECTSDNECDYNSICCSDQCFKHRICKPFIPPSKENLIECKLLDSTCKNDRPFPYETTKNLECTADEHCEAGSICCSDSCYEHRICKKFVQSLNEVQISDNTERCPLSTTNKNLCLHPKLIIKYACNKDADCDLGDICCEDKCYDHKLCKKPMDVYSYVAKPNRRQYGGISQCPAVEKKCEVPYSLRLSYSFKCDLEEDCPEGYSCCHDTCISYFKVCIKNTIKIDEGPIKNTATISGDGQTKDHTIKHIKVQIDEKNNSKIYFYNVSNLDEDFAEFVIHPITVKPEITHTQKVILLGSGSGDDEINGSSSGSADGRSVKKKCVNPAGFEDEEDCIETTIYSSSGSSGSGYHDNEFDLTTSSGDKTIIYPNISIYSGSGSGDIGDLVPGSEDETPKHFHCKNPVGYEDEEDCIRATIHSNSGNSESYDEDYEFGSSSGSGDELLTNSGTTIYIASGSREIGDIFSGSGDKTDNKSKCKNPLNYEDEEDCIDITTNLSYSGSSDYKTTVAFDEKSISLGIENNISGSGISLRIENHQETTLVDSEYEKESGSGIKPLIKNKVTKEVSSKQVQKESEKEDLDFGSGKENFVA